MRISNLCGAGRPDTLSLWVEPSIPSEPSKASSIGGIATKGAPSMRDGPASLNRPNCPEVANAEQRKSHQSKEVPMSAYHSNPGRKNQ